MGCACFGVLLRSYQYVGLKFGQVPAKQATLEFLTGYIVRRISLTRQHVCFVLIFGYSGFLLSFIIVSCFMGSWALSSFRASFIALGSSLLRFEWVVIVFGVFLVLTGLRMMIGREQRIEPEKNWALRLFRKFMPVTPDLKGQRLLARIDGKLYATPLLMTLVVIETADILFAID